MANDNDLRKFQQNFADAILRSNVPSYFKEALIPASKVTDPSDIINVHATGYKLRLTEALGETFEACWWVLGDELFFQICEKYVACNDSSSYNLSNYGENFPSFLHELSETGEFPFLTDLARFEWRFKEVFHLPQESCTSNLSVAAGQDFSLRFPSAFQVFDANYPVYDLWQKRVGAQSDAQNEFERAHERLDESVLFYKKEGKIYIKKLSKAERQLYVGLLSGTSVFTVLSSGENIFNEADVQDSFAFLTSEGLIKQIIPVR
jgi:hypothetical protein